MKVMGIRTFCNPGENEEARGGGGGEPRGAIAKDDGARIKTLLESPQKLPDSRNKVSSGNPSVATRPHVLPIDLFGRGAGFGG